MNCLVSDSVTVTISTVTETTVPVKDDQNQVPRGILVVAIIGVLGSTIFGTFRIGEIDMVKSRVNGFVEERRR